MQNSIHEYESRYGLEISGEVRRKMHHSNNSYKLITEEDVRDLQYVDVIGRIYNKVKRVFDACLSAMGLFILLIPLCLMTVAIYIDDPGKVIFTQYRVGLNGKCFKLFKLRTMKTSTPKYLSTMEIDDPDKYITRVGHILRKFSLDEIPQLVNVLIGDMSLVGPRPLISNEYEIHEMRMRFGVYNVRPGLTGLAQINGRDTVSPVGKVHWDAEYLQNYGLLMDLRILIATIPKVIGGCGVVEGYSIRKLDVGR